MIRFPQTSGLFDHPTFSIDAVLQGSRPDPAQRDEPGRVWVEVDGVPDCLCFYGRDAGPRRGPPLIYLEGDSSRRQDGRRADVAVDHRFVAALEPTRHVLVNAVLLAAAATTDGTGRG